MIPSEAFTIEVFRQTAAGAASTGKVLADFTIPAYLTGVAQSLTWTVTEGVTSGAWRAYKLSTTLPATAGMFQVGPIQAASGTDVITPDQFAAEIESYDLDSVANLLLTSAGIPAITSAVDYSLGDIVDGDSFKSATLTMPSGILSRFSITDISAVGITLRAAIMAAPGGTSYPITCTVVSGPGLTFNLSWPGGATQPHPALTTESAKTQYIDVQVVQTGAPNVILTTYRLSFNQVWQRETRTS